MRLTITTRYGDRDVVVRNGAAATLGDLLASVDIATDRTFDGTVDGTIDRTVIVVDGTRYGRDTTLRSLSIANGSVLDLTHPSSSSTAADVGADSEGGPSEREPAAAISQVAGWAASSTVHVSAGDYGIGAAQVNGLSLGPVEDATLFVRVTATAAQAHAGSAKFVTVEDSAAGEVTNARDLIIGIGDTAFTVTDPYPSGSGSGPRLWNRPPRTRLPAPATGIALPPRPESAAGRQALSWAMMLAPIPIGLVMAIFWSPIFALFILMSPVMMIARWWESGRASKKDKLRFGREITDALDQVSTTLVHLKALETQRRRLAQPSIAQLRRWALDADPQLWQRRRVNDDFLTLSPGIADQLINVDAEPSQLSNFPEAALLVTRPLRLPQVPVLAPLAELGSIGIAGPRDLTTSLARSLVLQAATLHGPADLHIGVVANDERLDEWDFLKWLPHLTDAGGTVGIATHNDQLSAILPAPADPNPIRFGGRDEPEIGHLAIIDHPELLGASGSRLRTTLGFEKNPLHGIIIASEPDQLPAACGIVVEIDHRGEVLVRYPDQTRRLSSVRPAGIDRDTAIEWSRALARFVDPEADGASAGIESSVSLIDILDDLDPAAIETRWQAAGNDPTPRATIGAKSLGPFTVDLAVDGPHGVVAGTTGSGKSELLRTMVASMSYEVDPDHLNFVLIDFKGGGAFDVCAKLPHVVSIVTDLDEHLAERALRCLKAELRLREETLRDAGATDLGEFLALGGGPLPRLVVIIDEFATLAAELPTFLDSLVDIAQRGRSLGVHMILATQRPSGVLDKKVKANTNLRVALRVQDDGDSEDVLGTNQAAKLSRHQPGRAFARFGQSEIVEFQAALVTGPWLPSEFQRLETRPFTLRGCLPVEVESSTESPAVQAIQQATPSATAPTAAPDGEHADQFATDIECIVSAIEAAFEASGQAVPRVPWPDPLPTTIDAATISARSEDAQSHDWVAPFSVVDLPERQTQQVMSWTPDHGTIALYGVDNKSLTDAMTTVSLALASTHGPDTFHLYGIEFGAKQLSRLAGLPHAGSIIDGNDLERTIRLIDLLHDEIQQRREGSADVARALTMVLVDNWSALVELLEDAREHDAVGRFVQIVRDGPKVGVYCLIGAPHERAIPSRVSNLIDTKLLFRMVDPNAYMLFGLGLNQVPELGPGRALDAASGEVMQVATYTDEQLEDLISGFRSPPTTSGLDPKPVEVLDDNVNLASVDQLETDLSVDQWLVPIGVDGPTLKTAHLRLAAAEHALVLGASGSGKSTTLATIAAATRQFDRSLPYIAVAHRRSVLRSCSAITALFGTESSADRLREVIAVDRVLVLVDDADATPDHLIEVLAEVAEQSRDERHMIAACRTDYPKAFDGWVAPLRRHKNGVILQPSPSDGDSLRTSLPLTRPQRFPAGRCYIITAGVPRFGQIALPPTITLQAQHEVDTNAPALAEPASTGIAYDTHVSVSATGSVQRIDLGLGGFSTAPTADANADADADDTVAIGNEPLVIDLGLASFGTDPTAAEPESDA